MQRGALMEKFLDDETLAMFSETAIVLDTDMVAEKTPELAHARATLVHMLADEAWKAPMLETFHYALLHATSSVIKRHATMLPRAIGPHFVPDEAFDIELYASSRLITKDFVMRLRTLKHISQILPAIRRIILALFDEQRLADDPMMSVITRDFCVAYDKIAFRIPKNVSTGTAHALSEQWIRWHEMQGKIPPYGCGD